MEILEELRRLGKTIFISSHILSELATLCDHVTIMDRGTVKYTGSMRGLVSQNEGSTAHYHLTLAAEHPDAIDAIAKLPGMLRITPPLPTEPRYTLTFERDQLPLNIRVLAALEGI